MPTIQKEGGEDLMFYLLKGVPPSWSVYTTWLEEVGIVGYDPEWVARL